jgi:DNA-binding MarR family transcriptional regulator
MANKSVTWALEQSGLRPGTKLVLVYLAHHKNPITGQCNPSQRTLARECEQGVSTVNRHLAILVRRGLIKRVRRYDARTGAARSTAYSFPEAP